MNKYQQPLVIKGGIRIAYSCHASMDALESGIKASSTVFDGEAAKSWRNSAALREIVRSNNNNTSGMPVIARRNHTLRVITMDLCTVI